MGTPLRVLILEDREADARLMVEQLREAGFDPVWRRVDTESDFAAQAVSELSVVLADYNLPSFDALQALQILQNRKLDVPFLIVTGALGDEAAAACMRQGVADYILKDRLARLGEAVKQALDKKRVRNERDRAETALRQAHDKLEERVQQRTVELARTNSILEIEIQERKRFQESLAQKVKDLQAALDQVKQLSGLLPICSYCKKIRDDENYWHQVDHYIRKHTDARFSHGVCPDCYEKVVQPELDDYLRGAEGGASDQKV